MPDVLLSLTLSRRRIACCLIEQLRPSHLQTRALESTLDGAVEGAVAFIEKIVASHEINLVALEALPQWAVKSHHKMRSAVFKTIQKHGIPIWTVPTEDLFSGYADPAIQTRGELRAIMLRFWPSLAAQRVNPLAIDTLALGLFAQVDRLLPRVPS